MNLSIKNLFPDIKTFYIGSVIKNNSEQYIAFTHPTNKRTHRHTRAFCGQATCPGRGRPSTATNTYLFIV